MIRINLLPHRAEKRRRRNIQFGALSGVAVILGVLLVTLGYGFMSARIFYQDKRNDYLKSEIAKLDKQIEELKRLRQQVKALLARKEVVEGLQSTRSDVVHLMDQMLRILPPGVYLTTLRQTNKDISITGITQSNARVSTLMRAIEQSPWLEKPHLIEVQGATVGKERESKFSMTFNISAGPPASAAAATGPGAGLPGSTQGTASAQDGASAPAAAPGAAAARAPVSGVAQTGTAASPAAAAKKP